MARALRKLPGPHGTSCWLTELSHARAKLRTPPGISVAVRNFPLAHGSSRGLAEVATVSGKFLRAATLFTAQTVQVPLVILHGASGPGTQLFATNATGIVAGDDGGTWAGVSDLALPFG